MYDYAVFKIMRNIDIIKMLIWRESPFDGLIESFL